VLALEEQSESEERRRAIECSRQVSTKKNIRQTTTHPYNNDKDERIFHPGV
jgi:hypothetical protein